jgi:hypothetical protein
MERRAISHRALIWGAVAVALLLALSFKATIRGDGIGYYSYLPALVANRTFDMAPTFDRFIAAGTPVYEANLKHHLANGLTANYKPVGSALMALPFYALTHLVMLALPGGQDPTLGQEYQLAFDLASLFYLVLALLLIYRLVSEHFGARPAALAVAAAFLATPLIAYTLFEPAYYHTFALFAITAFAVLVYRTHGRRRTGQWFLAGALAGLATIVHVNEVLFFALIPLESVFVIARRRWNGGLVLGYAAFAGGALLAGLPQLVMDRVMFGQWLPVAAPNIGFDFLNPHLPELLFSTHNGWLSWSPVVVVAILGLPIAVRRLGWFAWALIAICLGEVILNAALSDWYGGLGFGARRLSDETLIVALGLAGAFTWLASRSRAWAPAVVTAVFSAWNALLVAQFYYVLPGGSTPSWPDLLVSNQLRAMAYLPHLLVQGTVIRDLAGGDVTGAIGVWLALIFTVALATWLASDARWSLSTQRLRSLAHALNML